MLKIQLLSLLVGSLGLQATIASGWLRWQQVMENKQQQEEEETLTPYEPKEAYAAESLPGGSPGQRPNSPRPNSQLVGWEFKMVRANRDLFRDPAVFKRLCEEEALAGWILLEKLDDRRVRFKRPNALRDMVNPDSLPYDPYRTHYGPTTRWTSVFMGLALLGAIVVPAYLGYALVTRTLDGNRPKPSPPLPEPAPLAPTLRSSPAVSPPASPAVSPSPSPQ